MNVLRKGQIQGDVLVRVDTQKLGNDLHTDDLTVTQSRGKATTSDGVDLAEFVKQVIDAAKNSNDKLFDRKHCSTWATEADFLH